MPTTYGNFNTSRIKMEQYNFSAYKSKSNKRLRNRYNSIDKKKI